MTFSTFFSRFFLITQEYSFAQKMLSNIIKHYLMVYLLTLNYLYCRLALFVCPICLLRLYVCYLLIVSMDIIILSVFTMPLCIPEISSLFIFWYYQLFEVWRSDKLTNLEMLELGDNKIRKIENLEVGLFLMKIKWCRMKFITFWYYK